MLWVSEVGTTVNIPHVMFMPCVASSSVMCTCLDVCALLSAISVSPLLTPGGLEYNTIQLTICTQTHLKMYAVQFPACNINTCGTFHSSQYIMWCLDRISSAGVMSTQVIAFVFICVKNQFLPSAEVSSSPTSLRFAQAGLRPWSSSGYRKHFDVCGALCTFYLLWIFLSDKYSNSPHQSKLFQQQTQYNRKFDRWHNILMCI